jgi:hypothetical protein
MGPEQADAFRQQGPAMLAAFKATEPLPPGALAAAKATVAQMQASQQPQPGMGGPFGAAPMVQPSASTSSTTPLVSGAPAGVGSSVDSYAAALMAAQRRRTRIILAIAGAGVALGLLVGILLALAGGDEPSDSAAQPESSATVPAPSAPGPGGKQEPVPAPSASEGAAPAGSAAVDAAASASAAASVAKQPAPRAPTAPQRPPTTGTGKTTKKDPCAGKTGILLTNCRRQQQRRP